MNKFILVALVVLSRSLLATTLPQLQDNQFLNCWGSGQDVNYGFSVTHNDILEKYVGVPTKQAKGKFEYKDLSLPSAIKLSKVPSEANCSSLVIEQLAPKYPDTDQLKLTLESKPDPVVGSYAGELSFLVNGARVKKTVHCFAHEKFVGESGCLKKFVPAPVPEGSVYELQHGN